jgi:hypothetical protein
MVDNDVREEEHAVKNGNTCGRALGNEPTIDKLKLQLLLL